MSGSFVAGGIPHRFVVAGAPPSFDGARLLADTQQICEAELNFWHGARTDARSVEGFDAAVDRARRYVDAGADMIFPEALESLDEFARFAQAIEAPLLANTEFGKGPLPYFGELADLGYRAALYPLTAFRVAMKAAEEALIHLRDHGDQRGLLGRMQTRGELYDLLGYADWEARDRAYFGDIPPA